jgi:hypothetical protein
MHGLVANAAEETLLAHLGLQFVVFLAGFCHTLKK